MRTRRIIVLAAAVVGCAGLILAIALPALSQSRSSATSTVLAEPEPLPSPDTEDRSDPSTDLLRDAASRSMSPEQEALASRISVDWGQDPRFAGFEWMADARALTLWWFGDVPPELQSALASVEPAATVSPTATPPGPLREAAASLVPTETADGFPVSSAGAAIDGSRIDVLVDAPPSTDAAALEAELGERTGYPVSVEFGSIVPAM